MVGQGRIPLSQLPGRDLLHWRCPGRPCERNAQPEQCSGRRELSLLRLPAKTPAPPFREPGTEAFYFCGSYDGPADCCYQKKDSPNNPLMIRTRHWKSLVVLPMFRLSIIGA